MGQARENALQRTQGTNNTDQSSDPETTEDAVATSGSVTVVDDGSFEDTATRLSCPSARIEALMITRSGNGRFFYSERR